MRPMPLIDSVGLRIEKGIFIAIAKVFDQRRSGSRRRLTARGRPLPEAVGHNHRLAIQYRLAEFQLNDDALHDRSG